MEEKAPSLAAQAILKNTTTIIPDPERIPGFFKNIFQKDGR